MGFGRIVGHAMMGYGKGTAIVAQNEMDAEAAELEQRRRIALENLRAQNDSVARVETADLNDRNDARSTARDFSVDVAKLDHQEGATERRDQRLHTQDMESARLASQLRTTEDAASKRLADQLDQAARAGDVQGIEIDGATGEKIIVYKDGTTKATGIKATERELTPSTYGGAPSVLDQARIGQGLGAGGAPAPQPTTTPNKQQAGSGTYRAKTDAEAEAFVSNPANKGKQFVGPDGKTYTVK